MHAFYQQTFEARYAAFTSARLIPQQKYECYGKAALVGNSKYLRRDTLFELSSEYFCLTQSVGTSKIPQLRVRRS